MDKDLKNEYMKMNDENKKRATHEGLKDIFSEFNLDVKMSATMMDMSEGNLRNIQSGNRELKLNHIFRLAKSLDVGPWEIGSRFVYDRYVDFFDGRIFLTPVVMILNNYSSKKRLAEDEEKGILADYDRFNNSIELGDESYRGKVEELQMPRDEMYSKAISILKREYEEQWYEFLDKAEKMDVIDPKTFNETLTEIFYELRNEDERLQQYILTMVRESKNITKRKRRNE